jgi:hypothetical protein
MSMMFLDTVVRIAKKTGIAVVLSWDIFPACAIPECDLDFFYFASSFLISLFSWWPDSLRHLRLRRPINIFDWGTSTM